MVSIKNKAELNHKKILVQSSYRTYATLAQYLSILCKVWCIRDEIVENLFYKKIYQFRTIFTTNIVFLFSQKHKDL